MSILYLCLYLRRTERARNNDAIIDDVVTFDLGPNPQPQTLTTSSERESGDKRLSAGGKKGGEREGKKKIF